MCEKINPNKDSLRSLDSKYFPFIFPYNDLIIDKNNIAEVVSKIKTNTSFRTRYIKCLLDIE